MCGIVGVVGKIGKNEREVFRQLLIVDSLRGADSTGFLSAKGNRSDIFKRAGDPYFVMESRRFDTNLNAAANVLIGHNRYATVGAINTVNAHPFDFENVVGVHNGTLRNKWSLPDAQQFSVDSENLYHAINKDGVEDTIPKVLGAWSLAWWDKKAGTFNLLRNDERPMCMCITKDKKTIFFASEVGMLSWILFRNKISHEPIVYTAVDTLYTLPVADEWEGIAKELPDFIIKTLKGKEPDVFPLAHNGNVGNVGGRIEIQPHNLLNRCVEFEVIGSFINPEGARFIQGSSCDASKVTVLVSVEDDRDLEEYLMALKDTHVFEAYVQYIRYINGYPYLLVRKSSMKSLEVVVDITPKLEHKKNNPKFSAFPGYEGKALSMVEWRDKTAKGCSFCCEIPLEIQTQSLLWMDDTNFVCGACKDLPEVKVYLT